MFMRKLKTKIVTAVVLLSFIAFSGCSNHSDADKTNADTVNKAGTDTMQMSAPSGTTIDTLNNTDTGHKSDQPLPPGGQ